MGKDPDICAALVTGRSGVVLWLKNLSTLYYRSTAVAVNSMQSVS